MFIACMNVYRSSIVSDFAISSKIVKTSGVFPAADLTLLDWKPQQQQKQYQGFLSEAF